MDKLNRPRYVEVKRKKQKKKNYKQLIVGHIEYFLSVVSIHGLNHIVRSRRCLIERILWICIVFGSLVFGLLKGYEVFMHYYERPFSVDVEIGNKNWTIQFPSVTICQKTLIADVEEVFNNLDIPYNESVKEYLEDLAFSNYYTYEDLQKYANGSQREYLEPEEYIPVLLKVVATMSPVFSTNEFVSTKFPLGELRPIFTSLSEHGVCTTLNPSIGIYYTIEYLNSSKPYQYKPILYNYSSTNLKYYTSDIRGDYMVIIHSPHEMIDITSRFINARFVTKTTVTFGCNSVWTTDDVKELDIKQRQCKLSRDVDGLDHSPTYSYVLCRIECRIKLCLRYCNCTPYYYRRNPGEEICNMAGMYCLSKYKAELVYLQSRETNESLCNCLQNCDDDLIFITKYTAADAVVNTVLITEIAEVPDIRYIRKLIYTRIDLLIQVGGILGLCLGSSVLSIIEILYFGTLRLFWCVVKGKSIKNSL